MLDTVVIGGGPIGSWVAYRLATLGHTVEVLEQRSEIGQKPCCTGIVSQECVKAFAIPPQMIFRQEDCAKLYSPAGEALSIFRPETKVTIIDRPGFDKVLAKRAISAGAKFSLSSKAEEVFIHSDKVVVKIASHGENRQIEARSAILAAGFSSSLTKKMGLGGINYVVGGAQAERATRDVGEIEIYLGQSLAPGFFGWLVPTSEGRCLVGVLTRRSPGLKLREFMSVLEKQGRLIPGEHQIKYGGIPLKPLRRTFGRRVLAVGDAAGQVKPTTGGGIYFGLICAEAAASNLHDALGANDLTARRLSLYQKDWQRKLGKELRTEYFIRRIYEHLNDKQINKIFSGIKSSRIADSLLKSDEISFDMHGALLFKALKSGVWAEAKRLLRVG